MQGFDFLLDMRAQWGSLFRLPDVITMSASLKFYHTPNYTGWRTLTTQLLGLGLAHTNSVGNDGGLGGSGCGGGNPSGAPIPYNIAAPGNAPPPWRHPDQTPSTGTYPLSSANGVGVVNRSDQAYSFSGRGPAAWEDIQQAYPCQNAIPLVFRDYPYPSNALLKPDVVAPGGDVMYSTGGFNGDLYGLFEKTSAATPHVGGAVALMKQVAPDLTPAEVSEALQMTAVDLGPVQGKDNIYGAGRIDAYAAVQYVLEHFGGTLPQDFTIPVGETWNFGAVTVAFAPGARLIVEGTLNADGTTFTAEDLSQGWYGIRFQPGSSGSLSGLPGSDPLTVSEVNGVGTASVYVHDAEVSLNEAFLDGRPQGNDYDIRVAGVYARGDKALVSVDNTTITDHTDRAIRASSAARVYASGSNFVNSILSYGSYAGADVFLWENTSDLGASAQSYGTLWLGAPDFGYVPDLPNNDLNDDGLFAAVFAKNHGEVWAGVTEDDFGSNNYLLREVGGTPAGRGYASSQQYSDVTARYNWWGDANGPNLSLATVDPNSTFDYCPWLSDPIAGTPGGNCSAPLRLARSPGGTAARGDLIEGDTLGLGWGDPPPVPEGAAGHLWLAREAVALGRFDVALGLLEQAAREAGSDEEGQAIHRRALRLTASLVRWAEEAGQTLAVQQVETFLADEAESDGPQRPWALRAQAQVQAARGEHQEALAHANALVAEGGEYVAPGHIVRAFALASLGQADAAEAALAEAEAAAPGDEQVALAREELALWLSEPLESGGRAGSGAEEIIPASSSRATPSAPTLAVYPNPVADRATVALSLPATAEVSVTVFDVLGRRVTVLTNGRLETGQHRLSFDTSVLPSGIYVVRAVAGTTRTLTQRLTVVR